MRRLSWSVLVFVSLMFSVSSRAEEPAPTAEEAVYQGKTLMEWIGDLKDPKKDNHPAAAQALAVFGPQKESVSALADALKDGDRTVILHAAQTLGKFGPRARESLPALRTAFKKLEDALSSPVSPGVIPGEEELKAIRAARRAIAEALILVDDHPGPEFAPILLVALETDNADKCRDIVAKLGKLGPKAAKTTVPALIDVLADKNQAVSRTTRNYLDPSGEIKANEIRREAVKSLGRIGPAAKPAIHALTLAMKVAAPEKTTRVQQMEVSDKPAGAADATIQKISFMVVTGDKEMLRACAEALGRIRPEARGTVGALRLVLRDLDDGVRWAALCALLESGRDSREVVPILQSFLHDKDAALRRVAVEVLGKSGGEKDQILPALMAALKDGDASVRESGVKTLGELRIEAKQATPALIAVLKDRDAKVRAAAAEALGKMEGTDKEIAQHLAALLEDKDRDVFQAASKALGKFGPQAKLAIPRLLVLLHDSAVEKRAMACLVLGCIGSAAKEAISPLEKIAQDDSAEPIRLAAYGALANIDASRRKDTLPRLTTALGSKDTDVVQVAAISLILLGRHTRDVLPNLRTLRDQTPDADVRKIVDIVIEAIQHPEKDAFDLRG